MHCNGLAAHTELHLLGIHKRKKHVEALKLKNHKLNACNYT